jgi:hypothetical protein
MGTIWNIRGTNGSGKSHLARAFLPVNLYENSYHLHQYPSPTKKDPDRRVAAKGYVHDHVGVVGPYETACGGLDALPSFEIQRNACLAFINDFQGMVPNVIAEGILASTVYGSWGEFANYVRLRGHRFAFVYLHTPLEVCIERIKFRQAESGKVREIKWDQVKAKHAAILGTREKALKDGQYVVDLPPGLEEAALRDAMSGGGLTRVG